MTQIKRSQLDRFTESLDMLELKYERKEFTAAVSVILATGGDCWAEFKFDIDGRFIAAGTYRPAQVDRDIQSSNTMHAPPIAPPRAPQRSGPPPIAPKTARKKVLPPPPPVKDKADELTDAYSLFNQKEK